MNAENITMSLFLIDTVSGLSISPLNYMNDRTVSAYDAVIFKQRLTWQNYTHFEIISRYDKDAFLEDLSKLRARMNRRISWREAFGNCDSTSLWTKYACIAELKSTLTNSPHYEGAFSLIDDYKEQLEAFHVNQNQKWCYDPAIELLIEFIVNETPALYHELSGMVSNFLLSKESRRKLSNQIEKIRMLRHQVEFGLQHPFYNINGFNKDSVHFDKSTFVPFQLGFSRYLGRYRMGKWPSTYVSLGYIRNPVLYSSGNFVDTMLLDRAYQYSHLNVTGGYILSSKVSRYANSVFLFSLYLEVGYQINLRKDYLVDRVEGDVNILGAEAERILESGNIVSALGILFGFKRVFIRTGINWSWPSQLFMESEVYLNQNTNLYVTIGIPILSERRFHYMRKGRLIY